MRPPRMMGVAFPPRSSQSRGARAVFPALHAAGERRAILLILLLMGLGSMAQGGGPDPPEWVRRLGAEPFDDRVAAYKALERLGGDALPALKAAVDTSDPRVRSRVRALLDSLGRQAEVDRISRPTLIGLDFHAWPLGEVIDVLNAQHGLGLFVRHNPTPGRGFLAFNAEDPKRLAQLRQQEIALVADGPVPFWEAVDRLCKTALLRYDVSPQAGFGNGQGSFVLIADRTGRGPVSDSGPFRVQITGVESDFECDFTGDPGLAKPPGTGRLTVALVAIPEPGLVLRQNSPLTIEEAVDDLGRSLLPTRSRGVVPGPIVQGNPGLFGPASVRNRLELVTPNPPGALIRRLRGTWPVIVVARRFDPVVIPLKSADSLGKTFRTDDATLVVDQASLTPGAPPISLTVTIRPNRGNLIQNRGVDPRRPDYVAFRLDRVMEHLELYDSGGRKLLYFVSQQSQGFAGGSWFFRLQMNVQPVPDPIPINVPVPAPGPAGRGTRTPIPHELRYYEFFQTATEVRFDFRDIPLP